MYKSNLLKGKNILVTGGGSGLGLAMSHKLAEYGADL
ncbi:MAG TPA: SDR family oxidoreductase, partial [Phycisphaerales bacterium]|nr:SDR family oxidoreductase [Phycisphaerales bacterium]